MALKACFALGILASPLVSGGCGGGSSSPSAGPGSANNSNGVGSFNIGLSPGSLSVAQGGFQVLQVSISPSNTGAATIAIAGLPSGISTTPALPALMSTGNENITIFAARTAAPGKYQLNVSVNSGGISQSQNATLSVTGGTSTGVTPGRSQFVRTDDSPASAVYDAQHNLVFATEKAMGYVDVISPVSASIVKRLPVPDAEGIDITLDGKQIVVGTQNNAFYLIDAASQTISKRVVFPKLIVGQAEVYVQPEFPFVLSTGRILFFGIGAWPNTLIEYDPTTNSIFSHTSLNLDPTASIRRSADGTKVFISNHFLPSTLYIYDAVTSSLNQVLTFQDFAFSVGVNRDASRFVVAVDQEGVFVYDQNFNLIGQLSVGGALTGIIFSPDNQFLYTVTEVGGLPVILQFNDGIFGLTGAAPAYASNIAYFTRVPPLIVEKPMAIDANGFIYGGADHGLAIDDATDFVHFGTDAQFPVAAIIAQPDEGPVSGGTAVSIETSAFSISPDIYFGSQISAASGLNGQVAQALSPAASGAQVANLKIVEPNGVKAIMPAAFTYGGVVLPAYDWAVPPSGGASIDVFGYGLGADDKSTSVRVAGHGAAVSRAGLYPAEQPYPFPLQHLIVQPPAGTPGAADLMIASSAGTAQAPTRLHYLNSVQDFAFTGAAQYLLYDWQRERVYISTGDHIEVFSIGSSTFLQPIVPPTLHGKLQLAGMALTPDASTLLVANNGDVSIALIHVDDTTQNKVADVALQAGGPTQLAATSTGTALISFAVPSVSGGGGKLVQLDLATLQASLRNDSSLMFLQIAGNQLAGSRDGTKVFLAAPGDDGGPLYLWDASSDTWSPHSIGSFTTEAAAAADGNVYATTDTYSFNHARFVDPQLNIISSFSIPDFATSQESPVIGMRLHDTGALLYQPTFNGINIYDVTTGETRERISISEQVQELARPLEVDASGSTIFLLTNAGFTEVVLDSVPLSIGNLSPQVINAIGGTQLLIRGSGFQPGMTASINGQAVSTTIQSSSAAILLTPSVPAGPVSLQLTNPDGTTYLLDAAVTAQ